MTSRKRNKESSGNFQKRKRQDSSEMDSESGEESDVSEIQIDFSGFEIAPCDFTGIRLLLQQLFLKTRINLSEMSTFLIDQLDIGSVVKETEIDQNTETDDETNEDDTVYAVVSVIPLPSSAVRSLMPSSHQSVYPKFIVELRNYFLELSKQHATEVTKTLLHSTLDDSKNSVGFIINERYSNLPAVFSGPSFSKLKNEIDEMSKKDSKFNFTHYIMICKLYKIPQSKRKSEQKHRIIWCNAEEEIFDQEADSRFEFSVSKETDTGVSGSWAEEDVEMLPFRRVLLFSASKLDDIIQKISSFA